LISSCSTPESQKVRAVAGNEEVTTLYMDSCKKRRLRLNKSGLAARLKKLLARQHSSTRIWQHETNYFNPLRPNNRGMLLVVNSVWREYSRLMIHCTPSSGKTISPLSSESEESNSNSNNTSLGIIVVLDPLLYSHIRPSSTIRVYAPWQQLCVSRLNVTLVLGVSYVEEVNSAQKQWLISGERQPQVSEVLYTCQCSCQKEYLLPRKMQVETLHCGTTNTEQLSITEEVICQNRRMNTIAEVVAKQSCLQSEEVCLQLCILQVFRYKTRFSLDLCNENAFLIHSTVSGVTVSASGCETRWPGSNIKTGDDDTGWSVLGCDATGVCCELVLGSSPPASEKPQWWEGITSKQVLGKFCKFTGFTIKRRIHRTKCPSLWSLIVKNKEVNEKQNLAGRGKRSPACELENEKAASEKHVQELWEMEELEETPDVNIAASASPQLSSLKQTLKESGSGACRHSCVVKVLYITDDCMYVTDPSVCSVAGPGYVIVSVKPSCIIPKQVSSRKVTLALLQDVLADKGSLSADRYSWLEPVSSTVAIHAALSEQDVNLIANVKASVMDLASSSSVKDLVNVTGTVVGVDEETAFAWPVCGICENDILVELDSNEYLCQECNTSPHTFTKMSLEVFISCPQFPESRKVKVKTWCSAVNQLTVLSKQLSVEVPLCKSVEVSVAEALACVMSERSWSEMEDIEMKQDLVGDHSGDEEEDGNWSYEVRSRRQVLVPFLKEARESGQFARLCGEKLKINDLIFSVEECLESIKEPVVGSEEMERNRRVLKEKIRGLVSRSIGKDISSDNSHENSKASTTRSSSDRHGMRKEATSSDLVKPMTSSEEEISEELTRNSLKNTQHTIPDESTLRKTYAPSIYDETIQKIRDEIKDSSIWVSIDETPDKEGRLVGNVVIGLLSEQYSERILLHCDVLEKCNNKTIVKLFNEAMGILWPKGIMYDNVLFFISDAAPYMVKAGQALSVVYPKLTHFTCVAHAFHRVAEVVRDNFLK
ncbi:hypothetical protein ANN_25422, partial [Periplaneta americana]